MRERNERESNNNKEWEEKLKGSGKKNNELNKNGNLNSNNIIPHQLHPPLDVLLQPHLQYPSKK